MITPCIKYYNELNSTNSYALEHFEELNMGDIIVAEIQTHGRGRFDRVWEGSSPENIYMTFVIKPVTVKDFPFINLTQYLSVIINKIFNKDYNIKSNIKWPNDILFNGKKLLGILAESKMIDNQLKGGVLGVGINVNFDVSVFKELPNATSLNIVLNEKTDKNALMIKIAEEFFKDFESFAKSGFALIAEDYRNMCKFPDKKIKISGSFHDGEYDFVSINDDGTLSVLDKNKEVMNVISGDILC